MVLPAAADWIFICISLPAGLVRLLLHDRQKRGLFGACQLPGPLEFRHIPAGAGQYVPVFGRRRSSSGRDFFSPFGGIPSPAFVFQLEDQVDAERPDHTDGDSVCCHHPLLSDFSGRWRRAQSMDGEQNIVFAAVSLRFLDPDRPVSLEKLRLLHGDSAVRPGGY